MKKYILGLMSKSTTRKWWFFVVIGILFLNSCGLTPTAQTRGERGNWVVDTRVTQIPNKQHHQAQIQDKIVTAQRDTDSQNISITGRILPGVLSGNKEVIAGSKSVKKSAIQSQKSKLLQTLKSGSKQRKHPLHIGSVLKRTQHTKKAQTIPDSDNDDRKFWKSLGFFITFFGAIALVLITGLQEILVWGIPFTYLDLILFLVLCNLFFDLGAGLGWEADNFNFLLSFVLLILATVFAMIGFLVEIEILFEFGLLFFVLGFLGFIGLFVLLIIWGGEDFLYLILALLPAALLLLLLGDV